MDRKQSLDPIRRPCPLYPKSTQLSVEMPVVLLLDTRHVDHTPDLALASVPHQHRHELADIQRTSRASVLTRLARRLTSMLLESIKLRLNRRYRGRAVTVEGLDLLQVRSRLRRKVLDAEAEICFQKQRYAGRRSKATMCVRIVGLWDESRLLYHWYITNLPQQIKAEEIGKLYSARWTIELLFRELKSCYQLESIPSRKGHVVEAFLYASFLTLLASRALLLAVRQWGGLGERRIPMERWARLFVSAAPELLALVLDPASMARTRERPLLRFFVAEAPDPNIKRRLLLDRAGIGWAA